MQTSLETGGSTGLSCSGSSPFHANYSSVRISVSTWPIPLCEMESSISQALFPLGGQKSWSDKQPNDHFNWGNFFSGLPRKNASSKTQRCRHQQDIRVFNEQLFPSSRHDCRIVPLSMAGGTFLQMDQTASQDKSLLRPFGECGQKPDLDSSLGLCTRSNSPQEASIGSQSLHNFTGSERNHFRKTTIITGSYRYRKNQ